MRTERSSGVGGFVDDASVSARFCADLLCRWFGMPISLHVAICFLGACLRTGAAAGPIRYHSTRAGQLLVSWSFLSQSFLTITHDPLDRNSSHALRYTNI